MKKLAIILTISILLALASACSQATKTAESNKPETKANNSNSNGTKLETPKSNTSTTTIPAVSDIAGNYAISGDSLDGKKYDGEMAVTKRDDVYQFSWKVGASKYDGVGVQTGDKIAVAYANGADGKGCGAVIYKVNSADDSLEGKWGEWGVNQAGTETAQATEKTTTTKGTFDVSGTNGNGTAYKGKLSVTRGSEDVYQFSWDVGRKSIGTGVKMGDYLAAGSGSKECGFVIYETKNGILEGKWGVPGTTKLGTETATKK